MSRSWLCALLAMVHYRVNEKETNPNPYINFISSLDRIDGSERESARQLLRSLAAQVRPIMKSHGFSVNSFEEYEYNEVFAGRNWNAGETIELVLRRPNGTFLPTFWLMSTFCHELAHIKAYTYNLLGNRKSNYLQHMHHGPDFQALWKQLRGEVRALQDKGYYGDGYWSSGTRLGDSTRIGGQGIEPGDLPEYLCGGAQTRRRPTSTRTRRQRKPRNITITPSNSTGRQTAKARKAGSRVTSKNAFTGQGSSLMDEAAADGKAKGTGFGKQASSKRAREERALATERRLLALQNQAKATSHSNDDVNGSETDSDHEEVEIVAETDNDRREALLTSNKKEDLEQLKSGSLWELFEKDFVFDEPQKHSLQVESSVCGSRVASGSASRIPLLKAEGKRKALDSEEDDVGILPIAKVSKTSRGSASQTRPGRTEHTAPAMNGRLALDCSPPPGMWACQVCTLENEPEHLACSVCATPRGERSWRQR